MVKSFQDRTCFETEQLKESSMEEQGSSMDLSKWMLFPEGHKSVLVSIGPINQSVIPL